MNILIVNIGQIVSPLRIERGSASPSLQIVAEKELSIRGERIATPGDGASGKTRSVIDAHGGVVIPGLIDPHRFVSLPGVQRLVAPVGSAPVAHAQADLFEANERILSRALRAGVTTIELKSSHAPGLEASLAVVQQLKRQSDARVVPTLHASLEDGQTDRNARLSSLIGHVIPAIRQKRQAEFCEVHCGPGAYSLDEARMVLRAARGAGMKLKLQLDAAAPLEAEKLAYELNVSAMVGVRSASAEIAMPPTLASVSRILLPGTREGHSMDSHALRALLDRGALVGLGTGSGCAQSGPASLWAVLGIAVADLGLSLEEALIACTLGNAAALERDDELGTLEPGALADLAILDVSDYRELRHGLGENPVRTVILGGRVVHGP